ncbi:MAG: RNA polymerase sigma factor [Actinobacteria bacterium]|nr:RNA polymerase sigma factor [Actinomycetota bacterium]
MSEATLSVAGWVEQARAQNPEAMAWLYQEYADRICSHAYRMLGSRQDAEDITQETFIRAFRSIGQLRDEERLSAWLYSIASHLCLDHLRRRKLITWLPWSGDDGSQERADDSVVDVEETDLVRRSLQELPPKDRACLALRSIEGFSCSEIAEMMKCSEAAVWNRLARARAKFAAAYSNMQREEAHRR